MRLREAFADLGPFTGLVTDPEVEGFEADFLREHFAGRHWLEADISSLRFAAMEHFFFTDAALAYFLPAFFLRYIEDRDQTWAGNIMIGAAGWISRLFPLARFGYTAEQIDSLLMGYDVANPEWDGPPMPDVDPGTYHDNSEELARQYLIFERDELRALKLGSTGPAN